MRARESEKGLTLVEVLVALAILGAVAGSVLVLIGQNARFVAAAETRLMAGVLLDNLAVEALGRVSKLDLAEQEEETEFAGRRWLVDRAVTKTQVDGLVLIEIKVLDPQTRQVLASMVTLKAEN